MNDSRRNDPIKLNWWMNVALTAGLVCLVGCGVETSEPAPPEIAAALAPSPNAKVQQSADNQAQAPEPKWIGQPEKLLENDSLDGWDVLSFGGEGDCDVTDGVLTLEAGDPFTGVSAAREDLPKTNYEISVTARKTQGIYFFCGLTFPVAESHSTIIVSGWVGGLV